MSRRFLTDVVVHRGPRRRQGRLVAGSLVITCALGRSGVARRKREGDGATPVGQFRLLRVLYRADRVARPRTGIPLVRIGRNDGWCDDPGDRRYNRRLALPSPARHETLWREDALYDIVIDIAFNRGPILRGRGSAIFLHLARPDFAPTQGCVAVERSAMRRLLAMIGPRTTLRIAG